MNTTVFLGIDTATSLGGVALVSEVGIIAAYGADVRGAHGPRLMRAVERVLADASLRLADLAGIGVSIGPGSFTGLRVGVATAMGLGRAADLPLFPVPTLETLAWGVPHPAGAVVAPTLKSRRNEVYGAVYRVVSGDEGMALETVLAPLAATPADFLIELQRLDVPVVVAGDGAWMVLSSPDRDARLVAAPAFCQAPSAPVVAWRAAAMHAAGLHTPRHLVTPFYLKASQAEITWAERQAKATS